MTGPKLRARRLAGWILVAAMGLGQVARGQLADPGLALDGPPEKALAKKIDPWIALKGQLVTVIRADATQLDGRLIDVTPDALLVRPEPDAQPVSLPRSEVLHVTAKTIDREPSREELLAPLNLIEAPTRREETPLLDAPASGTLRAVTGDLAANARREIISGAVLLAVGAAGITLIAIALIVSSNPASTTNCNFCPDGFPHGSAGDHFVNVAPVVGGVVGSTAFILGFPIYFAGRSEQQIVDRLRSPRLAIAPVARPNPFAAGNPTGGTLSLSFGF